MAVVDWTFAHSQIVGRPPRAFLPPALAKAYMFCPCSCLVLYYMHTRLVFDCLEASQEASIRSLLPHSLLVCFVEAVFTRLVSCFRRRCGLQHLTELCHL